MPTLQEMVANIMDDAEKKSGEEKRRFTRPPMMAQYSELRLAWDSLQERHDIRPGMFVRFKKGTTPYSALGGNLPTAWIVVRRLNLDNEVDYMIVQDSIKNLPTVVHALGFDCIIATVTDDNGVLAMYPAHTSTLIPVSDEEAEAF